MYLILQPVDIVYPHPFFTNPCSYHMPWQSAGLAGIRQRNGLRVGWFNLAGIAASLFPHYNAMVAVELLAR